MSPLNWASVDVKQRKINYDEEKISFKVLKKIAGDVPLIICLHTCVFVQAKVNVLRA